MTQTWAHRCHLNLLAYFILAVTGLASSTVESLGADIFVNNVAGDDRFLGRIQQTVDRHGPLRTIRRALELASPGDRIVLANTGLAYHETISLSSRRHCGTAQQPFTIEGNGAVLDGSRSVPATAWEPYQDAIFRFRPERVGYQQLFLDGSPAQRRHVDPRQDTLPELGPLEWALWQGAIYFAVEPNKLPADYDLRCAAFTVGITLDHVHDVAISNLVVQGFQLDGINAHDGTRNCFLIDVTCRGNGRAGVTVAGTSRLQLNACLLGDNGTSQLHTEAFSETRLEGSDLLDNTAPTVDRVGGRIFVDGELVVDDAIAGIPRREPLSR